MASLLLQRGSASCVRVAVYDREGGMISTVESVVVQLGLIAGHLSSRPSVSGGSASPLTERRTEGRHPSLAVLRRSTSTTTAARRVREQRNGHMAAGDALWHRRAHCCTQRTPTQRRLARSHAAAAGMLGDVRLPESHRESWANCLQRR